MSDVRLLEPIRLGAHTAPNRVMFGPHVTNLGTVDRTFSERHVAYYERRAAGGCGVVVVEGASVHGSDWPYERAPLAAVAPDGWRRIAEAVHRHGALVIASLDHAGGQGTSAWSQLPLWAPSRVPEVNSREVPKWMEAADIDAVLDGFASAATAAVEAGCDGVEINAGQHSLVRQFLSGLTNHRDDEWGTDRTAFARAVIERVRAAVGDRVLGLRLSCDELAPWAGITPADAPGVAAALVAVGVDHVVVTRGSIFSVETTRPDFHEPVGHNVDVCRAVRAALGGVPVFLQGSVTDVDQAEWAIGDGVCDAVEMTRAQIADPDLVAKVRRGDTDRVRPCVRCNQTCQVRDARSPVVTCIGEPTSGHETDDPGWYTAAATPVDVAVLGAGVAGLEVARVAATRGHRVRVLERSGHVGGTVAVAGSAGALAEWLEAECRRLGVEIVLDTDEGAVRPGETVVQATGSRPGVRPFTVADGALVVDVLAVHDGSVTLPEGPIVLFDPIGGPIAVALAERIGARAVLVTPDHIAGNELSRTGDLAPANVRLQRLGVTIARRSLLRSVRVGEVDLEDRFSGEVRSVPAAAVVDCGFRLPDEPVSSAVAQVGDCVAPRTVHEAVLEARRVAGRL